VVPATIDASRLARDDPRDQSRKNRVADFAQRKYSTVLEDKSIQRA